MKQRDNEIRVRPGRIRDHGRGLSRPESFVGQVMRASKGKANPAVVNELLLQKLKG